MGNLFLLTKISQVQYNYSLRLFYDIILNIEFIKDREKTVIR